MPPWYVTLPMMSMLLSAAIDSRPFSVPLRKTSPFMQPYCEMSYFCGYPSGCCTVAVPPSCVDVMQLAV